MQTFPQSAKARSFCRPILAPPHPSLETPRITLKPQRVYRLQRACPRGPEPPLSSSPGKSFLPSDRRGPPYPSGRCEDGTLHCIVVPEAIGLRSKQCRSEEHTSEL